MVIHKLYLVGFFVISVLCASALLPLIVNAQNGMGSYGLNLNPSSGPAGTKVQVSLTIPSTDAYLYRDKTFSLVWDIGGWNQDNPTDWNTVQTAKWNIIGTATWDISGHLTGTATIPQNASNQIGHHVLYAIYEVQGESNLMNFYWGFFEITTGSTTTSTPTPTPTPTPSPLPTICILTVNKNSDFAIQIQDVDYTNESYSVAWPYGTTIKLHARYTGSSSNDEFEQWEWVDSNGVHAETTNTVYIELTSNTEASPKTKPAFQIPGFPFESIFIGLFLALGLLYLTKRKLTINRPMPT